MKIKNFDVATKALQRHLKEYLESQGIDTSKNFRCLNPAHNDSKPSMGLVQPENIRVFCHGCRMTGDLFDTIHWLEDKPLTSQAFMTETLEPLCEKYGVELEKTELTEEELYELDTYRAYRYASEYITSWNKLPKDVKDEFDRRNWTKDTYPKLRDLGVGIVEDAPAYREHMKKLGFSARFLDDVDLGRKDIFSPGHVIFTIKDEYGRPVGFAARNLSNEGSKYVNQKTTGLKCNIYQKGRRLYGFHKALKARHEGPIYIMEGYSDVISCNLYGYDRAVAACGTALTDDHIALLRENGIYETVLCLDGDTAGQDRTEKLLDTKFAEHKDMRVKVAVIPDEQDPDEYIREHGIEAFTALEPWTAFQWRLNRFDEEEDSEIICNRMIPHIVSEISHISQEKMLHDLARYTGFSLKSLQAELHRLVNEKDMERDRSRRGILDSMLTQVKRNPEDAEIVLSETTAKLYNLQQEYDTDNFSEESTIKFIQDLKETEEEKTGEYQGFVLGEDLHELQEVVLTGDWRRDVMLVFGGKANTGKTSLMCKLSSSIAMHKENNAVVIYHTIDDTKEQVLPKFICAMEGSTRLHINEVKNPKFYKYHEGEAIYDDIRLRRENGYQQVLDLTRDGHLVIKDANDGTSLAYAETLIKYYQERYPDRQVVYFLDNFHKLQDFHGLGDERTRFKTMSTIVKNIATKYHIPVLCTMEYTKLMPGVRPTNDNIAETVQMEYDANLIAHLYNEMHEKGDQADEHTYHVVDERTGATRRPIIELIVGKNKIGDFKSSVWFKFYPPSSDFKPHPLDQALAAREETNNSSQRQRRGPLFSN